MEQKSDTRQVRTGLKTKRGAYIRWLFGGIFGLHHFYLGRDHHALLTIATFGGFFGLGLIRDLWRIPEYVKEANQDYCYLEKMSQLRTQHRRPPTTWLRQMAMITVGNLFGILFNYSIPREIFGLKNSIYIHQLLYPFISAFGVWAVGSVGHQECPIWKPVFASYLSMIPAKALNRFFQSVTLDSFCTLSACVAFHWTKKWRVNRTQTRSERCIKLTIVMVYLALWTSWLYFECTAIDSLGEPVKCRKIIHDVMTDDPLNQMLEFSVIVIELIRNMPEIIEQIRKIKPIDIFNVIATTDRSKNLAILGLTESATQEDIVNRWKTLARQLHPDTVRSDVEKAEMSKRFIEVSNAYKKLVSKDERYMIQKESAEHEEL